MKHYIDADRLIAELERQNADKKIIQPLIRLIDSLQQEQPVLPGIDEEGIPGRDFIPVEWVDACERYGKWKIVRVEQPDGLEEAAEESWADYEYREHPQGLYASCYQDGFIAGAEWQKSKMMEEAIERVVKVDAGGYPYIDATELYDYEKDKPLAKAGDKVRVIVIKEDGIWNGKN